jgi:hypothetical protein
MHAFGAHCNRTKGTDEVCWLLPFGLLGRAVRALKVRGGFHRIRELFA